MFKIKARKPAAAKLLTGYDLAQAEIAAGLVPSDPEYAIKHLDRELGNVATYEPYTGRGYSADPFDTASWVTDSSAY